MCSLREVCTILLKVIGENKTYCRNYWYCTVLSVTHGQKAWRKFYEFNALKLVCCGELQYLRGGKI